ncbi:MAG: hypothetical protein WCC31_02050, partial [Terracidiphilus sp.]
MQKTLDNDRPMWQNASPITPVISCESIKRCQKESGMKAKISTPLKFPAASWKFRGLLFSSLLLFCSI